MSEDTKVVIDLDDPDFAQATSYDPEKDMDEKTPPPQLDLSGNLMTHLVKLSMGKNKEGQKAPFAEVSKQGNKYIGIKIIAQVMAPNQEYDKALINFPYGMVTSSLNNGTTGMANLARQLGSPMPKNLSPIEQAAFLTDLLSAEPTVGANLLWTGYCSTCQKNIPKLRGEKNWPELEGGGHRGLTECPDCNSEVQARVELDKIIAQ